jgi:transcriptional regulator with XRE-family HTH domain
MSGRDRFGPNLRRIREQRRISLQQIADITNVDIELWSGMEANDFSRWPAGIFARAFIREYARAIGVDPESTVDEFCRWFPQGDRRRDRIIRAEAELLGVPSDWRDDLTPESDRRQRRESDNPAVEAIMTRRSRIAAACLDLGLSVAVGAVIARIFSFPAWPVIGVATLAYHTAGLVFFGSTPGATMVAAWMRQTTTADLRRVAGAAFPRLRRHLS